MKRRVSLNILTPPPLYPIDQLNWKTIGKQLFLGSIFETIDDFRAKPLFCRKNIREKIQTLLKEKFAFVLKNSFFTHNFRPFFSSVNNKEPL